MRRRVRSLVVTAAVLLAVMPAATGQARSAGSAGPHLEAVSGGVRGPITGAAARAARGELLPIDPQALARAKSKAARAAGALASPASPAVTQQAPVASPSLEGLNDPNFTPSDSTGAIGPTSYIETVNSKVGIYDRSLGLLNSDTLESWWGLPGADVFDPQVIWDPTTQRFYYTGDAVFSNADNRLAFGFSTTASPANATTDWCKYFLSYGSEFPEFPKLGDSKDFGIVGVNVFDGNSFRGSDVVAFSKPLSGSTCPDPSTFKVKIGRNLSVNGSEFFTPVPANEIDTKRTGYVLTVDGFTPSRNLGLFTVTKNTSTGFPVIQRSGQTVRVGTYGVPPSAPQNGNFDLDTSDGRLTQSVGAIDPKHHDRFAIWTQHAVAGGAGSMERWYEIDPAGRTVLQKGTVSDPSLYVFNGGISPDRVVAGSTRAFGGNMVLGFTTSSSSDFPAIQMVSKKGSHATSAFVPVQASPGYDEDFACPGLGYCRWGDYGAATPDPAASTSGTAGRVWLSNMWTADATTTGGTSGVSWRTWNWEATP